MMELRWALRSLWAFLGERELERWLPTPLLSQPALWPLLDVDLCDCIWSSRALSRAERVLITDGAFITGFLMRVGGR
jgi:hypothetical protein